MSQGKCIVAIGSRDELPIPCRKVIIYAHGFRGYIAYRRGNHGLTILLPRTFENTASKVCKRSAQGPEKSTESNDGTFLNDGSVIARAFFDDAILLLRRCYDDVTSWKILVLPMVYVI